MAAGERVNDDFRAAEIESARCGYLLDRRGRHFFELPAYCYAAALADEHLCTCLEVRRQSSDVVPVCMRGNDMSDPAARRRLLDDRPDLPGFLGTCRRVE